MTKTNDSLLPSDLEEMLKTGLVDYTEVIIDRPVEEVWAALPEYRKWNPSHVTAKHTTIKGEPGAVGEVVEILKAGAAEAYYVETVRIRPLQTVDGAHKVANLVWKAYDKNFSFCNFVDFGVREYQGKTIFYRSYYTQTSPSSEQFVKMRQYQAEGKPDPLSEATVAIKEFLEKRR